jgi:hypothetical protein
MSRRERPFYKFTFLDDYKEKKEEENEEEENPEINTTLPYK